MITIKIKKIMEERSIKIEDIAPAVKLSERSIYNIFEGRKCPNLIELERFAAVLNVPTRELYESSVDEKICEIVKIKQEV